MLMQKLLLLKYNTAITTLATFSPIIGRKKSAQTRQSEK